MAKITILSVIIIYLFITQERYFQLIFLRCVVLSIGSVLYSKLQEHKGTCDWWKDFCYCRFFFCKLSISEVGSAALGLLSGRLKFSIFKSGTPVSLKGHIEIFFLIFLFLLFSSFNNQRKARTIRWRVVWRGSGVFFFVRGWDARCLVTTTHFFFSQL